MLFVFLSDWRDKVDYKPAVKQSFVKTISSRNVFVKCAEYFLLFTFVSASFSGNLFFSFVSKSNSNNNRPLDNHLCKLFLRNDLKVSLIGEVDII